MADFAFNIAQKVLLSSYSATRIGEYVKNWGSKFLVIMDPVIAQMDTGNKITKPLKDRNLDFFVFSNFEEHSDTKTIDSILNLSRQARIDGIIAAGGAKVIMTARAVAALYNEKKDTYTALDKDDIAEEPLPLICVPTVFRDRFVFSRNLCLTDSRSSKTIVVHLKNDVCKAVLIDPTLTLSLTENQHSSMYLETLGMALEAYISPKANMFSDMASEKALELLAMASSDTVLEVTTPHEELMCQGGLMASFALATSSMGISSLLSICINARYGITNALASAVLLPHILEDAAKYRLDKLAKAARIMKLSDSTEDKDAANALADFVRNCIAKANLPSRLKDLSVTIEQLSLVADDAGDFEFINTLPRSTTTDDLFELIKQAY